MSLTCEAILSTRLLFLCFIFLLIGCGNEAEQIVETDTYKINFVRKVERFNESRIGTTADVMDYIQERREMSYNGKLVLVLAQGSDCSGCRKQAYEIGARIQALHEDPIVLACILRVKEKFELSENGLTIPYLNDSRAIIKNELNLFHTPSLVFLDDSGVIRSILSVYPFEDIGDDYDQGKSILDFVTDVVMY